MSPQIVWADADVTDGFGEKIIAVARINGWPVAQITSKKTEFLTEFRVTFGAGGHYKDRLFSSRCFATCYKRDFATLAAEAAVLAHIAGWFECQLCHAHEDPGALTTGEQLRARGRCSKCAHWEDEIARGDGVVIAGTHYRIGKEPLPHELRHCRSSLGYGGDRHEIEFLDGRRVVTHNLWHQGEVPEHFRDRLPDNARFLRKP